LALVLMIFSTNANYGRTYGHAYPCYQASGEVMERYIVVDMFARAVRRYDPNEIALSWQKSTEKDSGR